MSMMISSAVSGAARLPEAAGVKGAPAVKGPEGEASVRAKRPMMDKYVPEEKREPSGRYWVEKDENGQPKICFDDPERPADDAAKPGQSPKADEPARDGTAPEKKAGSGKKAETCTGNTDKVDREIEKLKKEREQLKRQLGTETDEAKKKALEAKLAKIDGELRQKDNDAYRRQHTVFS